MPVLFDEYIDDFRVEYYDILCRYINYTIFSKEPIDLYNDDEFYDAFLDMLEKTFMFDIAIEPDEHLRIFFLESGFAEPDVDDLCNLGNAEYFNIVNRLSDFMYRNQQFYKFI